MSSLRFLYAVPCVFAFVATTNADRAPDDRKSAKFVIEGVVESVEKSEDGEHDWYLVRIRIQKVEKGEGLKVGEVLKATCYRLVRPKPKTLASPGHGPAPAKGTRIRAFISDHDTHGGLEGVYPEWYDAIEAKK